MTQAAETTSAGTAPPTDAPFYIPATNLPSRPQRALKHNDTFALFDSHGDIGASSGASDGLFHCDTRHLSHLELLVHAAHPLLLGSSVRDDNLGYYVDLTNPDIYADGRLSLQKDTVHIGRTMYLYDGSLRQRIVLGNFGPDAISLEVSITFASDFADIFEVRGIRRQRRGKKWTERRGEGCVDLCYAGIDDGPRTTSLRFDPPPAELGESVARYVVGLSPGASCMIFVTACGHHAPQAPPARSFFKGLVELRRRHRRQTRDIATVETSSPVLNQMLARSLADLYMLVSDTEDGPYPYAGIPWYSTTFGRDGLITAFQMLWLDPGLAVGVLRRLARLQARDSDAATDAEPGKILHEMRCGEMAEMREIPFGLYYGSVDSTPLFITLAGAYLARTGDVAFIRELWPALARALDWMDLYGDRDGDGLLEYARGASTGLANQGWKDSFDSVFHADGRLAEGPIALVEVQAYAYAAKMAGAACARALGDRRRSDELERQAGRLQERFEEVFWSERIGGYVLALDGAKRPCEVRTSNAGHALFAGIAAPERAARVVSDLLSQSFHCGFGIRTVARGEARYNPMSYHNGSVWPHDNALIAAGFARYGHADAVAAVVEAIMLAGAAMEQRRLPELFCGFRRRKERKPTLYPAACSPQAWAAAAPLALLQSLLGLEIDPAARAIRLADPALPAFVGDIAIRRLRVGDGSADFVLRRTGGRVDLEVLRLSEGVEVAITQRRGPGQRA